VAAATVVIAGLFAGGWVLAGHLMAHRTGHNPAPERLTPVAAGQTAPGSTLPAPSGSAELSGSPDTSPSVPPAVGTVAITSAAAQDAESTSVAEFLNRYFAAIGNHDYQAYDSLLSPQAQQGLTAAQFDSGYRSTADSAETLTGISTAANGDIQADVTFTSHQNPADSVDGTESCTNWSVSLYLQQNGSGYLIDQPPSSYHAFHAAC
jgi:hypothetical protein